MAYSLSSSQQVPTEDWDDGDFVLAEDQPLNAFTSRQTSFASTTHRATPMQSSSRPRFPDDPFEDEDFLTGFDHRDDDEDDYARGQGTLKLKGGGLPAVAPLVRPGGTGSNGGVKAGFISLDSLKNMQNLGRMTGPGIDSSFGQSRRSAGQDEMMDQGFGEDLDSDALVQRLSSRTTSTAGSGPVPLKLTRPMVERETDWDEFDALMDQDEREATLKAGSLTIKGLKNGQDSDNKMPVHSDHSRPTINKNQSKPQRTLGSDEADFESSFSMPLTLEHLQLASKKDYPTVSLRHRSSRSSMRSTTTSSRSDWDRDMDDSLHRTSFASPSTSTTSITSSSMPVTDHSEQDLHSKHITIVAEPDGDFENDLVLPTTSFFSTGRSRELNKLLDRKRKAPPHSSTGNGSQFSSIGSSRGHRLTRPTIASAAKSRYDPHEEVFEDGLVLDDEGTELNADRLSRLRKNRVPPATPTKLGGTLRKVSAGTPRTGKLLSEQNASDRLQGGKTTESGRVMMDMPSSHLTPATPHRLRTQKSYSRLADKPSNPALMSLGKKQSLASLRDAMAHQPSSGDGADQQPSYVSATVSSAARQAAKSKERFADTAQQPLPSSSQRTPSGLDKQQQQSRQAQTVPASATRSKSRPAVGSAFARPSSSASNPSQTINGHLNVAQMLKKPKGAKTYGDGTELDAFDDLTIDRSRESGMGTIRGSNSGGGSRGQQGTYISGLPNGAAGPSLGLGRPPAQDASATLKGKLPVHGLPPAGNKRKVSTEKTPISSVPPPNASSGNARTPARTARKKAGLIRHLGKVEKKQVGEMTWNPTTLRWEGNYGVLREFDNQLASSVRPALIAYRPPSAAKPASPNDKHNTSSNGSARGGGTALRVVGNMMFDPEKMCWISTLSKEDDEPDPFESLADDEDEDSFWNDRRGGTLTQGMLGPKFHHDLRSSGGIRFISDVSTAYTNTPSSISRSQTSESTSDAETFDEPPRVNLRQGRNLQSGKSFMSSSAHSVGGTDRTFSLASSRHAPSHSSAVMDYDLSSWTWVEEDLFTETRQAERRHTMEMKQWFGGSPGEVDRARSRDVEREEERAKRREEKRLWEIRHLVMD